MVVMVHRTRKTRDAWVQVPGRVEVRAGHVPNARGAEPRKVAVVVEFELASAGGGKSRVAVSLPVLAFPSLLKAMLIVNEGLVDAIMPLVRSDVRKSRGVQAADRPAQARDAGAKAKGVDEGGSA